MAPTQFTAVEAERLLAVAHELARTAGVLRLAEYLFVPAPALLELLIRRRPLRRLLADRMAVARGVTFDKLYPQSDPSRLVELSKRFPNACECVWIARMSGVSEEVLARFIAEISAASVDETTLAWDRAAAHLHRVRRPAQVWAGAPTAPSSASSPARASTWGSGCSPSARATSS